MSGGTVGQALDWGPWRETGATIYHRGSRDGIPVTSARLGLSAGVQLDFIRPGQPMENVFIKSFNGRLREECLNVHQVRLTH